MKKISIAIIVVLAVLILSAIVTVLISINSSENNINQGLDIYYLDMENRTLKSEKYNIVGKTEEEIIQSAFNTMKTKPKNEKYVSTVPENINILSTKIENGTLELNLSKEYLQMTKSDEMFCRGALIKTMTGISFIKQVEILIDGESLKTTGGQPIGPVSGDDIIISGTIEAEPVTSVKLITLYFSNSDGTGLVQEERKVEVNRNQPLEKYVMDELIKGPQTKGILATVPSETKVRNIMTQDGICYVDLSSEFVSRHSGGKDKELLTIYSIVNSLTALDDVSKVQFLIEGEKQEEYKGNVEFGQPFEPKEIVIE